MIVGVDEAGCGPAFGELVASAVVLPDTPITPIEGLADSKKLTPKKREALYERIMNPDSGCTIGVGRVSNMEIDARGLAWARRAVFHRALDDLHKNGVGPSAISNIIVDGTVFESWKGVAYECVVKADEKIPCVSAASIVAKVTRDTTILQICEEFPELKARYKIHANKGYLTKDHIEGIRVHGLTNWHRRSYHIKALAY
tara:strand:+ start:3282 stop:3881 length:600 start_codon:yes stop_codon:yes gene_type:complete